MENSVMEKQDQDQAQNQSQAPSQVPDQAQEEKYFPYKRPLADVYEKDNVVFIELEMPAAQKDSIEINLEKGELVISAKPVELQDEYELSYSEFAVANYQRKFRLGEELDKDSIEANYKNGILTLSIKKSVPLSRKIELKN